MISISKRFAKYFPKLFPPKHPLDTIPTRGDSIWNCSKCGKGLYVQDIVTQMALMPGGVNHTKIKCMSCGHIDPQGEVRDYKGNKYAPLTLIIGN